MALDLAVSTVTATVTAPVAVATAMTLTESAAVGITKEEKGYSDENIRELQEAIREDLEQREDEYL